MLKAQIKAQNLHIIDTFLVIKYLACPVTVKYEDCQHF